MSKVKTLYWDVETSLMSTLTFSLWPDHIPHENVIVDSHLLCVCWKWAHERAVHGVSILDDPKRFKKDIHDDYHVVATMHAVLSEADELVHHHGDAFDIKVINKGFLKHGFPPIADIKMIDTCKIAKRKFKFTSNKLDALGEFLGVGHKLKTGMGLWRDCFFGDEKALKKMFTYCKQDVRLLERVHEKIKPFQPESMGINRNLINKGEICPKCESKNLQARGYRVTRTCKYRRFQCQDCGSWASSTVSDKGKKVTIK